MLVSFSNNKEKKKDNKLQLYLSNFKLYKNQTANTLNIDDNLRYSDTLCIFEDVSHFSYGMEKLKSYSMMREHSIQTLFVELLVPERNILSTFFFMKTILHKVNVLMFLLTTMH